MATSLLLRCLIGSPALVLLGLHAPLAAAQGAPPPEKPKPAEPSPWDDEPAWQRTAAVRRSGFTAGFAGGLALGSAAGFPNDVKKLGRERYYTETGVGVGTAGMVWIGGALSDWLTFGIGMGAGTLTAGDTGVSRAEFLFHVETFPLFSLGGIWREVGVIVDTGLAGSTTTRDGSDEKLIDSGAASRIGGGIFYEGFRLWKISAGPYLYGDYLWSATVRQPGALLGLRTVIYTGQSSRP